MLDMDRIKSDFAHASKRRCSERGCTLGLGGLGNHLVLKGEELCPDRQSRRLPMCDCIIFVADGSIIIGIVELKSKTADPGQIEKKLANSSRIALDILGKYLDSRIEPVLYHIVLCKGWRTAEHRAITSRKIKVRGRSEKYNIITDHCGVSLSTVISKYKK
jgi:hypothetical protein